MKKKYLNAFLLILLPAFLLAAVCYQGVLSFFDNRLADALFQRPEAVDNDIVIFGIDEKALKAYGPFQDWDRTIVASALEMLNSDPQKKPAVVAIDTLYSGTTDAEADRRLADAAKALGCVITGGSGVFGTRVIYEDDTYRMDTYAVLNYEESYDALKAVTTVGHINAMYDTDGVLRHAILYIDVPNEDGEGTRRVYSMAKEAAQKYNGGELTLPETDVNGHYFVTYTSRPGELYDGYSVADLINGDIPADYYAGKIVMIGPYAAGLQDNVVTPIQSSENMFGIEYQANVIHMLLAGNFKRNASQSAQAVLVFLICVAAGILFHKWKLAWGGLTAVLLVASGIGGSLFLFSKGYLTHPLWIPLSVAVVYVIALVRHYLQSRAEKRMVTQTFERYVDPEIVSELLKEGSDALDLGGKLCDIAVLFVDIRGFTTMSEGMSPETVVSILNEYLTMTSDCVKKNKGTLDKFVGDCTMAFWGAPIPNENAIDLSLQCAKDIADGAKAISKGIEEKYGVPLRVGVGVNYGPAVVGNIGAANRMDYTAIGDTVNTAARLEANAPAGMIYISRAVADGAKRKIRTTSLGGSIKLKGKAEGFEVLSFEDFES